MEDNNTELYLHTKKGTEEVFYVGIGKKGRAINKNSRSKYWKNIVYKYGYEITILSDNLTWKQACDMEIYLIKYYGRRDLGEGNLVNMTDGGEGSIGVIRTAEWSAKISASKKGKKRSAETIAKLSGIKRSAETIAKLSAASKGRIVSAETRAKISAGNKGKIVSKETGAKISAAKKGKKLSKEHIAKLSAAHTGKKQSAETIAKRSKSMIGKSNKLTEAQAIDILRELRDNTYYGQLKDLAKKYRVHKSTISKMKNNKNWTHICRETLTIKQEEPYRN